MKQLKEEEASKLINEEEIKISAVEAAEQNGSSDEIDKVCRRGEVSGTDVSREGFNGIYCHLLRVVRFPLSTA